MNIKEYISSGILESYVMGELSESEMAEVQKNLLKYPELRTEFSRIEETQEALLMASAVTPSDTMRRTILEKIQYPEAKGKVVPFGGDANISFWRFAATASFAVALISSYFAYNYYNKWKTTSGDLTALIAQNERIAQDYNQVNKRLDKLATDVAIMDNPQFKRVIMKGTQNTPEALASVYWNASSKEVYLRIQNMKSLTQEKQYQLWAIIDGKPVDAGVFDGNLAGLLKMKDIAKGASNFAVTIEPRGGRQSPTMETLQVLGNVEKS